MQISATGIGKSAALIFLISNIFTITVYLKVINYEEPIHSMDIKFSSIESFYDKSRELIIDDVVDMEFVPRGQSHAYGHLSGSLWYRFQLKLGGDVMKEDAIVRVGIPSLNRVTLYYLEDNNTWKSEITGDTIAHSDRPLRMTSLGFILPHENIERGLLYIKMESSGSMAVSLEVGGKSQMFVNNIRHNIYLLTLLFFNIAALGCAAILYTLYRKVVFLIFVLSHTVYIFAAFSYSGLLALFCLTLQQMASQRYGYSLGSNFKCNTRSPQGIGCCDGQTWQAPQQRGTWRDFRRA